MSQKKDNCARFGTHEEYLTEQGMFCSYQPYYCSEAASRWLEKHLRGVARGIAANPGGREAGPGREAILLQFCPSRPHRLRIQKI